MRFLLLLLFFAAQLSAADRPNVVVFIVDDMGVMDSSVPFLKKKHPLNDLYRTPNMERLAASGIRFSTFYANSVCSPSRVSLMTGQSAARHRTTQFIAPERNNAGKLGAQEWQWKGIAKGQQTLAALLKDSGYQTIHAGKAHFGPNDSFGELPQNFGFDVNIAGCAYGQPGSYYGTDHFGHAKKNRKNRAVPGLEKYHGKDIHLTEALTLEINTAISDAVAAKKPFFAYMSHYAVHSPFQPDKRFAKNYENADLKKNAKAFATMVEGMDKSLGDMLDHLESLGVAENTLVLFLGDNGTDAPLGNAHAIACAAPLRGKKATQYEGGLRVPFIASWAKRNESNAHQKAMPIPANMRSDAVGTIHDIFPTVLKVADVAHKGVIDGKDLSQALKGGDLDNAPEFLMHFPHQHRTSYFTAYRKGDWKIIYHYHRAADKQCELFNLAEDPSESKNLAETNPAERDRMVRVMATALDEADAQYPISDDDAKVPLRPVVSALPSPNILFFLADDMGFGDTSAYQQWNTNADAEQIHTPNMERLAARGITFTDAHSSSSRCTASRYALLTGRYCWRTHLKQWVLFGVHCPPLIERDRTTLPEFLQANGYRTGMVGKWHLGLTYSRADGQPAEGWADADLTKPLLDGPVNHGFEFFHGISRSHPTSGPGGNRPNTEDQRKGPGWIHNDRVIGATGKGKQLDESYQLNELGEVLQKEAESFLTQSSNQPFFLYFASPANHSPYTPSAEINGTPVSGASTFKNGAKTNSPRLDFIHQNDVHIGHLLDWLERTDDPRRPGAKLVENTLFVFASDNGAEVKAKTATGPVRSNKGSTYEGGHRIPFIASWPAGGIVPDSRSDQLVGLNDVFATVAEILDKPLPENFAEDSAGQLSAMRGNATARRIPFFPNDHSEAIKGRKGADRNERAWIAVRSNATPIPGRWKLFLDHSYAFDGKLNPRELYDLSSDAEETNNRIGDATAKPALEFLLTHAKAAAGDGGKSRPQ